MACAGDGDSPDWHSAMNVAASCQSARGRRRVLGGPWPVGVTAASWRGPVPSGVARAGRPPWPFRAKAERADRQRRGPPRAHRARLPARAAQFAPDSGSRPCAREDPRRQAHGALRAPLTDSEESLHRQGTALCPLLRLWAVGPVESCPDGARGFIAADAPVGSEGADDIEPVMACGVTYPWTRGTTVVLDFDPGVVAWADLGPDGEGAAGQPRVAVEGGVRRQFGGAEDHIVCHRALVEHCTQVDANDADVLGGARVGDAGGQRECSVCWHVHQSSLDAPGHGLPTERTLNL